MVRSGKTRQNYSRKYNNFVRGWESVGFRLIMNLNVFTPFPNIPSRNLIRTFQPRVDFIKDQCIRALLIKLNTNDFSRLSNLYQY
jgi:hypothetical protein